LQEAKMQLTGTAAIITGGASGMGAATARRLAAAGALVSLFDQNEALASSLAKEIGGLAFACDVRDEASVMSALQAAATKHGTARICINCAGIAPVGRIVGREGPLALSDFTRVIDINLVGTFNVMRLAAHALYAVEPVNADGERGVIINTASVAAYEGQIGQAAYSASKGGIVAMTLPAAREFSKFGIRVNAIAPGLIATPLFSGLPEAAQHSLADSVPFPKRLGKPEEFASLVQAIIENPMINGTVIRLDGALRMA
jgi:NAD(P)-dependent dehydrogenase (short-subunit alcohol dehydrogenase family)